MEICSISSCGICGSNTDIQSSSSLLKKTCPKLQTPFMSIPPDKGVDTDVMMNNFSKFVMETIKNSKPKSNLTSSQHAGLKSLKRREDIHISVSDKCGDFVVTTNEAYKN